jgi:hypothetical protein
METSLIERPIREKAWAIEALPKRTYSSRSVCRRCRRIADRARPVTVSDRQSGGTTGFAPRITSTTSPF